MPCALVRAGRVVLHLANGNDNGLYRWWFDNVTARFDDFDVIAASYYGYWHGSLGDLQANLTDVSQRYDKDVFVAETAYPFTLGFDDNHGNIIGLPEQLVAGYAATPQGQAANFRDVLSIVRAIPPAEVSARGDFWDRSVTWPQRHGGPETPHGQRRENQRCSTSTIHAVPVMSD